MSLGHVTAALPLTNKLQESPLLMTFGAGKRPPDPCSFTYTVQVKPCTASFSVTALTLEKAVEEGRGRVERERTGEERKKIRKWRECTSITVNSIPYPNDRVLTEMTIMDLFFKHV